ncbi:MAG: NAD(P)-dependent glycerol-3-phosphate dehydrogenase [Kiritimatiellae bacterium]|jgi:glycerol-3-phosphate dehydrogenase (NAD(P)+)|nr:NAD(P)-dependent glycerol-3-phosphate dehydrogenase [Kiritimatiellia bacterium]
MKISIIGDGGWGTAIGILLNSYGHKVTMWCPFEENRELILSKGENIRFLPGIKLPDTVNWVTDSAQAVEGADGFVLASPSKFLSDVCKRFAGLISRDAFVVSLAKGICEETHKRMSETAQEILGLDSIAVLSGPSHAEEVARGIPTAVTAASTCEATAKKAQELFTGPLFRVYSSDDPVGVELGGAVKNVIAIAVGASDGLGFGDNTRAALITRGLAEVTRFGIAMGAKPETFAGLSGVGDLIVTCTSTHSRNHTVGERLGKGESIKDILASMKMVAEGVWNAKTIHAMGQEFGVEMPITDEVYRICYEDHPPLDAVRSLMSRDMKFE